MKWISQQVEKREKWVGKWPGVCEKQKKKLQAGEQKARPKQEVVARTRTMGSWFQDQDVVSLAMPQTDSQLSGTHPR